jgi:hypothetical protein
MTKDDILEMARETGMELYGHGRDQTNFVFILCRFANEVAAAEREACAKLCDAKVDAEYATGKVDHNEMGWTQACALSIRARGQS